MSRGNQDPEDGKLRNEDVIVIVTDAGADPVAETDIVIATTETGAEIDIGDDAAAAETDIDTGDLGAETGGKVVRYLIYAKSTMTNLGGQGPSPSHEDQRGTESVVKVEILSK